MLRALSQMSHGPRPLQDRRQSMWLRPLAAPCLCGSSQVLPTACRCEMSHSPATLRHQPSCRSSLCHIMRKMRSLQRMYLICFFVHRKSPSSHASVMRVPAWPKGRLLQTSPDAANKFLDMVYAHGLQVTNAADLQHAAKVCQIEWNANGTWLAVATEDGRMSLWRQNLLGSWKLVSTSTCVDPGSLAMVD